MAKKSKSRRHQTQRRGPRTATQRPSPLVPGAPMSAPSTIRELEGPLDEAAAGTGIDEEPSGTAEAVRPAGTPVPDARRTAPTPAPAGLRRVSRIDPATGRKVRPPRPGSTAAAFEPLDSEDPAIPFDRVPYVPADLRRVAIMAGLMIVLIIIATVLVSNLVK